MCLGLFMINKVEDLAFKIKIRKTLLLGCNWNRIYTSLMWVFFLTITQSAISLKSLFYLHFPSPSRWPLAKEFLLTSSLFPLPPVAVCCPKIHPEPSSVRQKCTILLCSSLRGEQFQHGSWQCSNQTGRVSVEQPNIKYPPQTANEYSVTSLHGVY